ncbi:MAG: sugar ABC transporter substrate-binding protein [Rhodoferax sp.]|uniref:sugar ABC transporter substrate-binding protein n=1 Tax=Rhodoferax sp. TaxID=50421 RepID=UPI003264D84F
MKSKWSSTLHSADSLRAKGGHFAGVIMSAMCTLSLLPTAALADAAQQRAEARVARALDLRSGWDGPTAGPRAVTNKSVVFVAVDLKNSGIAGALAGVREAAAAIGWKLSVIDAVGDDKKLVQALKASSGGDGIILGGFTAADFAPWIGKMVGNKGVVVGWHSAFEPGAVPGTELFTNVATSSREVSLAAASYAVVQGKGRGGMVVFTDTRFGIARAKADDLSVVVRNCRGCELLEVVDMRLDRVDEEMPAKVEEFKARFGARWTHTLGINDLYADALANAGNAPKMLSNISAGDGSPSAFRRIRAGTGQAATVAEPLNLQGWQLVDELNRAFAGERPSGYVPHAHLVVGDNVMQSGGDRDQYDPDNGYRQSYRKIWGK